MERNNLEKAVTDLKKSIDRIDGRLSSRWRGFWFGALHGAGAVLGAALFVAILGFIVNILDVIPFLQDITDILKSAIDNSH